MGKFDITTYNNLLPVKVANARFAQQLSTANITRKKLFSDLAPLFTDNDGNPLPYGACLLHRHYSLNNGERMVANGNRTSPSTMSDNIVAERWFPNGDEVEHRFTDNPAYLPPPPSADFMASFSTIINAYGIDTLGVCYAPGADELAPGYVFLEKDGAGDREQITITVTKQSLQDQLKSSEAAWVPTVNPDDHSVILACVHNCQEH